MLKFGHSSPTSTVTAVPAVLHLTRDPTSTPAAAPIAPTAGHANSSRALKKLSWLPPTWDAPTAQPAPNPTSEPNSFGCLATHRFSFGGGCVCTGLRDSRGWRGIVRTSRVISRDALTASPCDGVTIGEGGAVNNAISKPVLM